MLKRYRKKQLAEINVVPYIDVMLVLLIIFMVTTPLLSQGVKVDLPNAQAQPIATKAPEPIIISVDAHGNYYINTAANPAQSFPPQEIAAQVKQQLLPTPNQAEQRQVLVKGDKNVDYGKVVQIMVVLQQAGAGSVGLMTQDDDANKVKTKS